MHLLLIMLESVDVGLAGGGAIGGVSIIGALVLVWRAREATNRELIEVLQQRAVEAEKRAADITQVLDAARQAQDTYSAAIEKHAESGTKMAEATIKLAEATVKLAEVVAKYGKAA